MRGRAGHFETQLECVRRICVGMSNSIKSAMKRSPYTYAKRGSRLRRKRRRPPKHSENPRYFTPFIHFSIGPVTELSAVFGEKTRDT